VIPATARAEMIANFRANFGKGRTTDFKPVVKIFDPAGGATWLLSELGPDEIAFGLCDTGQGCPEIGYVSVHELAAQRNRLGLLLEIDRHFRPTKPSLNTRPTPAERDGSPPRRSNSPANCFKSSLHLSVQDLFPGAPPSLRRCLDCALPAPPPPLRGVPSGWNEDFFPWVQIPPDLAEGIRWAFIRDRFFRKGLNHGDSVRSCLPADFEN